MAETLGPMNNWKYHAKAPEKEMQVRFLQNLFLFFSLSCTPGYGRVKNIPPKRKEELTWIYRTFMIYLNRTLTTK